MRGDRQFGLFESRVRFDDDEDAEETWRDLGFSHAGHEIGEYGALREPQAVTEQAWQESEIGRRRSALRSRRRSLGG